MARKKTNINGYKYYRRQITGIDGKRKNFYAKTEQLLNEKVADFLKSRQPAIEKSRKAPTLSEYSEVQLLLLQQSVQPQTYKEYSEKVHNYITAPPLGEKSLAEITEDDIRAALSKVSNQSASSYKKVHMLFRRIFRAAKHNHLIDSDPTEFISSKGGRAPLERSALSDEQVGILLSAIEGLPVETFVRIGLEAGLRREEILGLRWDCIHLEKDAPYISVQRAWRTEHNQPVISDILKTNSSRRNVTIPSTLAEYLEHKKASSTSEYVICNARGAPLSETQWRHLWNQIRARTVKPRKYVRYSGGKKSIHIISPQLGAAASHNPNVTYSISFHVTPHMLRHTYATNLINGGFDPKITQYLMGHSNSSTTMDIYAKAKYFQPADLSNAINAAFHKAVTRDFDELNKS